MKISIIGQTNAYDYAPYMAYGFDMFDSPNPQAPWIVTDADALSETAGRVCYKSFDRPNPATAVNTSYMRNIIKQGHFSVLEHVSVTFLVQDVSRSLLAELTRHRHLSFSVVSQRYVDYSNTEPVMPPAIRDDESLERIVRNAYGLAVSSYESLVDALMRRGLKRKQAREAARCVLPNAAPVDMVVSGNLRAWRDVLGKRWHVAADAEIREFAGAVLTELRGFAPNSLQDIPTEPYGSDQ
ncbi:hypothetical protein TR51_25635 [Kitasatospora griseola]|uniref:Flavin-dependent thymidylate synthase n=1 Tax=Kitasatospora griseola TaxID=2064 RepID=A0A0D0PPN4_KITGR|nr:FAD-dependent thymidylate synthase [Kitasatospora griseola]KIQ62422.1 hypothetical protein TR51_25635 [Kitasatospora griseola]